MRLLPGLLGFDRVVSTSRWIATLLVLGAVMVTAHPTPSFAQSHQAPPHHRAPALTAPPSDPSGSSLPEWAEPQDASPPPSGRRNDSGVPISTLNGPPDNPNRVPLGGIEWLILAGAGYGIFRLRRTGDNGSTQPGT